MKSNLWAYLLISLICAIRVYGQGRVVDDSFYSTALGETRMVDVYLPEGYDTDTTRYPVVYFLHGHLGDQDSYPEMIPVLDTLIGDGIIRPVIFVKPSGFTGPYGGSFYTNSELYGNFEDYIAYDLVDYIDATYRTLAAQNRRAIMGHSMGGYGAMKIGLKHPDIYCAWVSHSGLVGLVPFDRWIEQVLEENGGSGPYEPLAGYTTYVSFAMAGAFSPNLDNPPTMVDFFLDDDGNRIDSVWERWLRQ